MYFLLPALALAVTVSAAAVVAAWAIAKLAGTSTGTVAVKLVPATHLAFAITVFLVMLGISAGWAMLYTLGYLVGAIPSLIVVTLYVLRRHRALKNTEPEGAQKTGA